jgi:hypothetical protein
MSASTWMQDTPAIHQSKLMNICLPASHDSGTYALKDAMSPQYGSWVQELVNLLESVASLLNGIPWLNKIINPAAWVTTAAIPAVRGLATATTRTIAQQLADGIRCLDLRICYFTPEKQFYTYHGLLGSKMTDVLNDIQAFLKSTKGEIVYITMGHWAGFDSNQSLYDQFSTMVENAIGDWAYVRQMNGSTITNNPFDQTYQAIIGQGGTSKSRVILVNGQSTSTTFWPLAYSPPDNDPNQKPPNPAAGSVIAGYYTNTTTVSTMTSTQKSQQQQAGNLPFALYMTLTPNGTDYAEVVVTSLAGAVAKLGVSMLVIPFIGIALCAALEAIAAGLAIGQLAFSWRTLEQLSQPVDDQLNQLVYSNFTQIGQPNNISFIYIDFYERSSVVSLAVALSLANASSSVPQLPIVGVNQFSSTYQGVTRYQFTDQSSGGGGWGLNQQNVFRAYSKQSGTAVPVYSYYYNLLGTGWNFMLSTNGTPPSGWNSNGIAFYAFLNQSDGLMPIYQYAKPDSTWGTLYYYSPSAGVSGWGNPTGVVCYALAAPLVPVYALESTYQGVTRYDWSQSNAGGQGWGPGSVVFLGSAVQQGAAVQVNSYYYNALGIGWSFRLSTSTTAPSGYQLFGALCYAWPSPQPGLAGIREFSQPNATFGTIYMYSPAARVAGWTAGNIVFYAALPPLTDRPGGDVNVLDLAALAIPAAS